jgi:hypothetical protein
MHVPVYTNMYMHVAATAEYSMYVCMYVCMYVLLRDLYLEVLRQN